MKRLKIAVSLFVFAGLLLVGCTEKSELPVSPSGKSSLQKNFTRAFTATNTPFEVINFGIMTYPDGKVKLRNHLAKTVFAATYLPGDTGPDLLSGTGEVEINGLIDANTIIGPWQGKFKLTPEGAGGGIWQFTWHGTSTYDPTAWEGGPGFIIPLKEIAHGEGGDINGMQCRMEVIIYCALDFSGWYGDCTGVITSH